MRVFKYLARHKGALALVVLLLAVQAFCDLSLPNYTADIVDVGIQQSGIQDSVPQQMSRGTYGLVQATTPDPSLVESSYEPQDDGLMHLTQQGESQREALAAALDKPMAIVGLASQSGVDVSAFAQAAQTDTFSSPEMTDMLDRADRKLDEMGDALVRQQAIAAVKAEYEACGFDVAALQLQYLLSIALQMLGVTLLGACAAVGVGFLASRTGAHIGRELRRRLFTRVVGFSDAEIQSFSAASLITRGTNDIQQIQTVCVMLMRMVLYAPILAIGGIVMVSRTNVFMSWIIVLAVLIIVVIVGTLMVLAMPKFKKMQILIDRVNLVSREILTGLPVIRAFNRQKFEEGRFDIASTDLMRTQLFTNRVMTFMMPLMMLVMNGVSALIVWVGASYIDAGTIQTGDMIAFITYSMVIIMSFLMLSMVSIILPRADVAAGRIDEVLACEGSIVDPLSPQDAQLPQTQGASIAFEDVTFSYKGSAEPVLQHVSFKAEPGKTTALIGSTGCGKSTVLKLIERFYDVSDGRVLIDGIDVRDITQKALRAQIGYVPQQAFLFNGTVHDNIAYRDERMDDDAVLKAAEIAQATEFIESKEEGLQTEVSQGGTNVSGGQRQRLAIARALAGGARAFLFDDSFSALDYATDAALRHALETQLSGTTVIIVAQRISTIMHADSIIVIDNGRIVGQGTHDQLLATCPTYGEIAASQLSPDELGGGDAA